MATKKKTPTKKVVAKKKSPPPYKYVGINGDGEVFATNGPIQLYGSYCIWLTRSPNIWSDEIQLANDPVILVRNLDDENIKFTTECLTWEEYEIKYPAKKPMVEVSTSKQLKFCK